MPRSPSPAPDVPVQPDDPGPAWRAPLFALVAAVLVALATIYVTR